jgi:hypothetical protein
MWAFVPGSRAPGTNGFICTRAVMARYKCGWGIYAPSSPNLPRLPTPPRPHDPLRCPHVRRAAPLPALQSQAVPTPLAVGHTPPAPVLDLGLGMWGLLYLTSSPGWTLDPYGSYQLKLKVMSLPVWWQKNGGFETGQTRCKQTIIIYPRSFFIFL